MSTFANRASALGYVSISAGASLAELAALLEPSLPPNVNAGVQEALAAGWTPDKSTTVLPIPLVLHDVADQRFMEGARERWRRRHPDRAFPEVTATALLLAGWSYALRARMVLLAQDIQDQAATYTKGRGGQRTSGFGHSFAGWMKRLVQMVFPARLAEAALNHAGEALLGTEWDSDNLPDAAERLIAKYGEDPEQKERAEKEARIAAEADTRPADAESAYFTSAMRTADKSWVALRGPYETHEAALRAVPDDEREAQEAFKHDKDVMFGAVAFGTVRAPRGTKVVLGLGTTPTPVLTPPRQLPAAEESEAIAAFLAWFDRSKADLGTGTTWNQIETSRIDIPGRHISKLNQYLFKLGRGPIGKGVRDSIDVLRAALQHAPKKIRFRVTTKDGKVFEPRENSLVGSVKKLRDRETTKPGVVGEFPVFVDQNTTKMFTYSSKIDKLDPVEVWA